MIDRRGLLFTGALTIAASTSVQSAPALGQHGRRAGFTYLRLKLPGQANAAVLRTLAERVEAATPGGSDDLLGLFSPQLGWSSRQAALLLKTSERDEADAPRRLHAALTAAEVSVKARHRLEATLRPASTDRPRPGGIYVHRWFTVQAEGVAEFLALSAEGWSDFERRFDARIFGLFQDMRTADDVAQGVTRLLLLTRYGSHAVWEASRDPSTSAMRAFARRQALTLDSWAASTLLVTPQP